MLKSRCVCCGFLAIVLTCLLAGCEEAGRNLTPIQGWPTFEARVLRAPYPVLIVFSKNPCPTCEVRKAELDAMYPEFKDRVFFAKMSIMEGMFEVTEQRVQDLYKIEWVPTVMLFIGGREVQRWILNVAPASEIIETLRRELAKLPPNTPRPPAARATTPFTRF